MTQIIPNCRPQVLLLGNGLNLCFGGSDWKASIGSVWKNPKISAEQAKNIPFPLQVVVGTNDDLDNALREKPDFLYGLDCLDDASQLLRTLACIRFDHILTTNYSYEIERILNSKVDRRGDYCKHLITHTDGSKIAESKYMLHTYNSIQYGNHLHKIWHIHGEARKPNSVILGHYYYGKLLGKYISELDKRKNIQQELQKNAKPPRISSWLDAFIMGDVYILGFGYDFSERDMWWLLNRKKRENAQHGTVIFYEPSYGKGEKFALLEAYGAEIADLECREKNPDYLAFYQKAIRDIANRVNRNRKEDANHVQICH